MYFFVFRYIIRPTHPLPLFHILKRMPFRKGGDTVQWQRENGLTPDGIAGTMTRRKLLKLPTPETNDWWNSIRHFSKKEFACKCGRYCDGHRCIVLWWNLLTEPEKS